MSTSSSSYEAAVAAERDKEQQLFSQNILGGESFWLGQYLRGEHSVESKIASDFFIMKENYSDDRVSWKYYWKIQNPNWSDVRFHDNLNNQVTVPPNGIIDYDESKVFWEQLRAKILRIENMLSREPINQVSMNDEIGKKYLDREFDRWMHAIDRKLEFFEPLERMPNEMRAIYLVPRMSFKVTKLYDLYLPCLFADPSAFFKICLAKTLVAIRHINKRWKAQGRSIAPLRVEKFTVFGFGDLTYGPSLGIRDAEIDLEVVLGSDSPLHHTTNTTIEPQLSELYDQYEPMIVKFHQACIGASVNDHRGAMYYKAALDRRRDIGYYFERLFEFNVLLLFGVDEYNRGDMFYHEFLRIRDSHQTKTGERPNEYHIQKNPLWRHDNKNEQKVQLEGLLFDEDFEANLEQGIIQIFEYCYPHPIVVTRLAEDPLESGSVNNDILDQLEVSQSESAPQTAIDLNNFIFKPQAWCVGQSNNTGLLPAEFFRNNASAWLEKIMNFYRGREYHWTNSFLRSTLVSYLALYIPPQMESGHWPQFEVWDVRTMRPY